MIQVEGSFFEKLQSVSGVAVPVSTSAFMVEVFQGAARGAVALPAKFQSEVAMQASVKMNANILIRSEITEHVHGVGVGSRNENVCLFWSDELMGKTWGSKRMHRGFFMEEDSTASAFASKNVIHALFGSEFLTVLTEAGKQSTDHVLLTVILPPGGELRIDSETFRVLLDGENVLYAQEGDWVNLSRDVRYLDIESVTGGMLEGSITYQERYL